MKLYFDPDPNIQFLLHQWIANELGHAVGDFTPEGRITSVAMGVAKGDETIAVIVYHDYQPEVPSIQVSLATTDPRWCTRKILKSMFAYPFNQLGVRRLWGITTKYNTKTRNLLERLGFKFESKANMALPGGKNGYVYWMPKSENKWTNGKISTSTAPGTKPGDDCERTNRQQH